MNKGKTTKKKCFEFLDLVEESGLLLCKFSGTFCFESAEYLLVDVCAFEQKYPQGFNRFSDLSGVTQLSLTTKEIHTVANQRSQQYKGPKVKSAIYAPDPLYFGMLRIYAAMIYPAPIEVNVSYSQEEAAAWLGLPQQTLQL